MGTKNSHESKADIDSTGTINNNFQIRNNDALVMVLVMQAIILTIQIFKIMWSLYKRNEKRTIKKYESKKAKNEYDDA